MSPPFITHQPLRFGDCDPSGIAYFPSWLNLLNGAVEDFWVYLGHPLPELIAQRRLGVPTVQLECRFVSPGVFGEQLEFAVTVAGLGRSSLQLEHRISGRGGLVGREGLKWTARQTLVVTSLQTHRAVPWPADLRAALQQQLSAGGAAGSAGPGG